MEFLTITALLLTVGIIVAVVRNWGHITSDRWGDGSAVYDSTSESAGSPNGFFFGSHDSSDAHHGDAGGCDSGGDCGGGDGGGGD